MKDKIKNKSFTLFEEEVIEKFFELAPNSYEREFLETYLSKKDNYQFSMFVQAGAYYIVNNYKDNDKTENLIDILYRYIVCFVYLGFLSKKKIKSNFMSKITSNKLTIEALIKEYDYDDDDPWSIIFKNRKYNDEFKEEAKTEKENEGWNRITKILSIGRSFFEGYAPLKTISDRNNNTFYLDEMICDALHETEHEKLLKKRFEFTYIDYDKWKSKQYINDEKHAKADLNMLALILKDYVMTDEYINAKKVYGVKGQVYYRMLINSQNGSFNQINLLTYDKLINLITFDFSKIRAKSSLIFELKKPDGNIIRCTLIKEDQLIEDIKK